jgi:hypothetical protein
MIAGRAEYPPIHRGRRPRAQKKIHQALDWLWQRDTAYKTTPRRELAATTREEPPRSLRTVLEQSLRWLEKH